MEELTAEDPLRIEFNSLHQYSVWIMLGAMIVALILFFLIGKSSNKILVSGNRDEFRT